MRTIPYVPLKDLKEKENLIYLKEAFLLYDKEGDSKISCDELEYVLRSIGYDLPLEKLVLLKRKIINSTEDSKIDFEGLMQILSKTSFQNDNSAVKFRNSCALFDVDKRGYLDCDHMYTVLTSFEDKLLEEEAEEAIEHYDYFDKGYIPYEDLYEDFCSDNILVEYAAFLKEERKKAALEYMNL